MDGFIHIYFPKENFIIKKGGIPNYKNLSGTKVVVTKVTKNANGSREITLKRENDHKFFNSISVVKANYEKAIEEKEILFVK